MTPWGIFPHSAFFCVLLLFLIPCCARQTPRVSTTVDLATGAFAVRDTHTRGSGEGGGLWLSSDGRGVFLRHRGDRYGVDDGSLSLVNGSTWRGRDAWGLFREWALTYEATPMDGTVSYLQKQLVTSFFSFLFLRR
jgi:hypothetical protein